MRFRFPLLIVALLLLTARVHAEDRPRARDAYREGTRRYDVGDYQHALDSFKQAYLYYEDPAFLFNMAQCYRALDNKVEALRTFRAYLRHAPSAPNADEIKRIIAALDSAIEKERAAAQLPPFGNQEPRQDPPKQVATPAPTVERVPIYKQWWLWTAVGGVVIVGVAVGVGVAVAETPHFKPTFGAVGPGALTITGRF